MNTPESARTLAEDILARAAEDWVSASEMMGHMRRSGATDPNDLRDLAVGLIARLLIEELVVAGDIVGSDHRPWPLTPGEAIIRIATEWAAEPDPFVTPGAIVWLNATAKGAAAGKAIWRREGNW